MENPLASGNEKFAVFVEEVERMRPATYWEKDSEAKAIQVRDLTEKIELTTPLAETGPRFMAYVPITRQ